MTSDDLRRIAVDGYYQEIRDSERSFCDLEGDDYLDWCERQQNGYEWEKYATLPEVNLDSIPENGTVFCCWGGATVNVKGDVGDGAVILCKGGGATVTIDGNVGERVRILAVGGGANLTVEGSFGFQSTFYVTSNGWVRLKGRVHPEVQHSRLYSGNRVPVYYE